jgi:hypothetical protein
VNKLLAILALTALSCATSRAREGLCPVCPELVSRPCPGARPVPVLPPLPAPPLAPALDKVPPGCGPAFLECLTPEEDAKLKAYYQAVKDWSVQVYRLGCSRGR